MENKNQCRQCAVCGKNFSLKDLVSGEVIRNVISDEILKRLSRLELLKFYLSGRSGRLSN